MASIRKKGKGGNYYARFYDSTRSPSRKEIPLRTTRKTVARKRVVELEEAYERGEFDPWTDQRGPETLSLKEASDRFLDSKSGLRPNTIEAYDYALKGLREIAPPGVMLQDVSPGLIQQYVMDAEVANSTQRHRYRHLRAFFNWATDQGFIDRSPMQDVNRPKKQKKQPAFLSPEQIDRILTTIDAHRKLQLKEPGRTADDRWLKHMIRVGVATGLRRGELLALRWNDIDLNNGLLYVRNRDGHVTKSGKERSVPLAGDAKEVLLHLKEQRSDNLSGPVFLDGRNKPPRPARVSKRFKFYVREAKLKNRKRLHFHSLRHTTASWLAMKGVPMRVIQQILGHASVSQTEVYSHLQPEVMQRAMHETFGE